MSPARPWFGDWFPPVDRGSGRPPQAGPAVSPAAPVLAAGEPQPQAAGRPVNVRLLAEELRECFYGPACLPCRDRIDLIVGEVARLRALAGEA